MLNNMGTYHLSQDDYQEAIRWLERTVEIDPEYTDALVNLALSYIQTGNDQGARRYAQQALQIDPGNPKAQQILNAVQ